MAGQFHCEFLRQDDAGDGNSMQFKSQAFEFPFLFKNRKSGDA
jgi:hypothetical protein